MSSLMAAYPEPQEIDAVFRALADPSRRLLLDRLNERNGRTLRELCAGLGMARQSVSKHLAILEAAQLVTTVRRGREKLHYLNAAPINELAERWINRYDQARVRALADLKRALEEAPMQAEEVSTKRPTFAYTSYIKTTPERLWQALTEPAFTERYWRTTFETDWQVGSTMTWHNHGVTIADPEQVVLESDPYRRLSYTWHTLTPELAEVHGFSDEVVAKVAGEGRSKVTFEIEQLDELCKLTVVHDGFEAGSTMLELVSGGWPHVLSELKTLLETGETFAGAA
ncbi:MAG TPA: metalloregulator ArsR/SmtB family transcription factor [Gaiellaceae bacterium]|nr:metalloregulator ArsR/SmtB family transcription factor [Gaiellaceae bacterium]